MTLLVSTTTYQLQNSNNFNIFPIRYSKKSRIERSKSKYQLIVSKSEECKKVTELNIPGKTTYRKTLWIPPLSLPKPDMARLTLY